MEGGGVDDPVKPCPRCQVFIPRVQGCARMTCWYCLDSLDEDALLIHYDKGPCRNKLGHSRASVIWHRTQVRLLASGSSCWPPPPSCCWPRPSSSAARGTAAGGPDDPLPT
ncbi:unnamed protein product [Boreogadus saida]